MVNSTSGMPEPTAEEITEHMVACGHSVKLIDKIVAGTYEHPLTPGGNLQEEINDCVDRNVKHLQLQQSKQWYIDDEVSRSGHDSKESHAAGITSGEEYIAANPV